MSDFFGKQDSTKKQGDIMSSEYIAIDLGAGEITLGQSVDMNYSQIITPMSVLGTPGVFWVIGRSEGTLGASRLVGTGGFAEGLPKGKCGIIETAKITAKKGQGACFGGGGSGSITINGAVTESIGLQANSGTTQVTTSVRMRMSYMSM